MDVWQVELNGQTIGIMKEGRSWQALQKEMPDLKLWTLREVAVAIQFYAKHGVGKMTEEVKENFPGAEVIGMKAKGSLDEEIPF